MATEKRDKYHQLGELVVKVLVCFLHTPALKGWESREGIRRYLNRIAKHQPHEPSYTARKLNIASEKGCLQNYFSFGFRCLFRGENCDVSREKTLWRREKIISHLNLRPGNPKNCPWFWDGSLLGGNPETYGGFLKCWYPQIIYFNMVFHYKPSILGYHYFRKHPYGIPSCFKKEQWHACRSMFPRRYGMIWLGGNLLMEKVPMIAILIVPQVCMERV